MDIPTSLKKTLQQPWSAWRATRPITSSANMIDDIYSRFNEYENKIKNRILISLLAFDKAKEASANSSILTSIKRLLAKASNEIEQDPLVTITAGLVYQHLFNTGNEVAGEGDEVDLEEGSCIVESSHKYIDELTGTIINRLNSREDLDIQSITNSDESFYFQPLECKYLDRRLLMPSPSSSYNLDNKLLPRDNESEETSGSEATASPASLTAIKYSNNHLTYVGEMPDFLEIDRKRSAEASRDLKIPVLPLGHGMRSFVSAGATTFTKDPAAIKPAMSLSESLARGSGIGLKHQSKVMQSIGLEQVKAFHHQQQQQEQQLQQLEMQQKSKRAKAESDVNSKNVPLMDPNVFLSEGGNFLSDSDKDIIQKFFSSSWQSHLVPEGATTPLFKIKLSAKEEVNESGERVQSTTFLTLNCADHSWKKTRKVKKL